MAGARVIHFVLGDVRTDARVRKSGRAVRDMGHDVIYIGEARDPLFGKKRFFQAEDLDQCPHFVINDGRRIYDNVLNKINALNPLYVSNKKIKTSISQALQDESSGFRNRIQALSLVPIYAACLGLRPIKPGDIWDRMRGFQTRSDRLASELMSLRPDIIHAHDLSAFAVIAPYCRANGVKLIYDSHELESGRNAPRWSNAQKKAHAQLEADSIQNADVVITVSYAIGKILKETYEISEPIIVPNSPPKANIRENTKLATRLELPEGHKVILYLGGIMPGRGLENLFEILPKLPERVHLAFIGYPVRIFEHEFEDLINRSTAIRHRIHLLGRKPYEDVIHEAYGADIGYNAIALSCKSYRNALPNKFFEYVFANVPVLSTPQSDVERLTNYFGLGAIVADGDFDALIDAINGMLSRPYKISEENRKKFIEEYCWEKQSLKLDKLYTRLID